MSRNLNETLPGVQIVMPGKKTLDQYAMDISSIILFGLDARPGLAVRSSSSTDTHRVALRAIRT